MKRFIVLLIAITIVFVGCTSAPKAPVQEDTINIQVPSVTPVFSERPEPAESETEKIHTHTLSEDIFQFTIDIGGIVYMLPEPYIQFKSAGWEMNSLYEDTTLEPNSISNEVVLKNGDGRLKVVFRNISDETLAYAECYIYSITIDEPSGNADVSFRLPNNINNSSTREDILNAYGYPALSCDFTSSINYEIDRFQESELLFGIEPETGRIKSIKIANRFYWGKTEDSGIARPAILDKYKEPNDLGVSWESGNVRYFGELYHIPAPVEKFVQNGWTIMNGENRVLRPLESTYDVIMRLGNRTMAVPVCNYADTSQPIKHCFVTKIVHFDYDPADSFELAGGFINSQTTEEELDSICAHSIDYNELAQGVRNKVYKDATEFTVFDTYVDIVDDEVGYCELSHDIVDPKDLFG